MLGRFAGSWIMGRVRAEKMLLVVSYIGYSAQEVKVIPGKVLKIKIKEDAELLDEVVVVGYGTQKKVNLTGAVETVDADVIENRPIRSATDALQGTVSGLTVTSGAGSWGSALAVLLANNGHEVTLWTHDPHEIEMLSTKREQVEKLPGVKLPDNIMIEADLKTALTDEDVVVMAVPSPVVRMVAKQMSPFIKDGQIIVNVAKGIEDVTYKTLSDIIEEEIPNAEVCVLSGPSHAEEVGRGIPTTVVVGAKNKETAEMLQDVFMNKVFRVYTSSDIVGIELGGALKNVIALAAGTVDGLGYGDNTKAALMTRGIAELTRLGEALGGKPETFSGLTGVGDLIVTCTSVHSRNRKAGYLMGKGMTAEEAMKEVKMVVEGVYSAKAALGLAKKCNVAVPIVEAVNRVLFENADPKEEVSNLLLRERKQEHTNLEWN